MTKLPLRARLLGLRTVEQGNDYFILRFPFWCPSPIIEATCEKVRADLRVMGQDLRVTHGNRLARFERAPMDDTQRRQTHGSVSARG